MTKELYRGKRTEGIKVHGVMWGKYYRERERELKEWFTKFKIKWVRGEGSGRNYNTKGTNKNLLLCNKVKMLLTFTDVTTSEVCGDLLRAFA
jgi:hypothetical protein